MSRLVSLEEGVRWVSVMRHVPGEASRLSVPRSVHTPVIGHGFKSLKERARCQVGVCPFCCSSGPGLGMPGSGRGQGARLDE